MKYSHLLKVLDESGLTPEELAPEIGVSNMTLRRWREHSSKAVLNLSQEATVREGIYRLIVKGHLEHSSKNVSQLLGDSYSSSFAASLAALGVTGIGGSAGLTKGSHSEDTTALLLAQIGQEEKHRDEVQSRVDEISTFKKFGQLWSGYITGLLGVISSAELSMVDKTVAYGALFYLLFPFDLIPDAVPVAGYLDDFALLAIAGAFYVHRFPKIYRKSEVPV